MYMGGHVFCSMLYLYSTCGNFQGGWFNKKVKKKKKEKRFLTHLPHWQVFKIALPHVLILVKKKNKQKKTLRRLNFS